MDVGRPKLHTFDVETVMILNAHCTQFTLHVLNAQDVISVVHEVVL